MSKLLAASWGLIGIVALMLVLTVAAPLIPDPSRTVSNVFAVLSYVEWLVVISGAVLGLVAVTSDRRNAAGVLGLGLYTLVLGLAFVGAGLAWAGTDNAFLGLLALGGLATLAGAVLAGGGLIGLIWEPAARAAALPVLGSVLPAAGVAALFSIGWLLLRGPGDWASTSTTLSLFSLPLVVAAVALGILVLRAGRASVARPADPGAPVR